MTNAQKKKISRAVKAELQNMLAGVDGDKAVQGSLLADNIAFMAGELAALREDIAEKGSVMMVTNGNNITSLNTNPALKAYNAIMKTFLLAITQMQRVMPEQTANLRKLIDFINDGKPSDPGEQESIEE